MRELYGVCGEYGFYGEYVYGDYNGPADEYYADEQWWLADDRLEYMVSTHGRIWSNLSGKFLKPKPMDGHGHLGVMLVNSDGSHKYEYVHRLMAKAFIPNPDNYPVVRHLNDNPWDNHIDNLAWGTQADNMRDCADNGRAYIPTDEDRRKGNLPRMMSVVAENLSTGVLSNFESQGEASRVLGIPQANIWKVLNGKRKAAGGYSFRKAVAES